MLVVCFFFLIDTATAEIYTLSLHDALPISGGGVGGGEGAGAGEGAGEELALFAGSEDAELEGEGAGPPPLLHAAATRRSEEHTSELQSRRDLVCRLLLEKKKKDDAQDLLTL